ncbi:2728_t:CDS:2 [Ambispora gerdemannii]|uniref:2728_t:CDS:1 n=1 Tax=Ambispora gerdemannii TaxID=144530 RepID=A0A9N8VC73_9GLOM|nr:2728_t:CDS:2 [Ambispora gerdemannii]
MWLVSTPECVTGYAEYIEMKARKSWISPGVRRKLSHAEPQTQLEIYSVASLLTREILNNYQMLKFSNVMEARTGRDKQVYKKGSIRQVAGCVPVNTKKGEILLITRRKGGGWILPKGGWENDESKQEAAARETFEEAGAKGRITGLLGVWDHHFVNESTGLPKAMFSFFEMEVDKLEEMWPEMGERDRKWFHYDEAVKMVIKPFMREVIQSCSLAPHTDRTQNSDNSSEEDYKDTWIWQFSVVIVVFAFFVWLVSTRYDQDPNPERIGKIVPTTSNETARGLSHDPFATGHKTSFKTLENKHQYRF